MLLLLFSLVAIHIGFALPEYTFDEPEFETLFRDIVLVREGGRLSERTFQVSISVGGTINRRPATLDFEDEERADYRLTSPRDFISLIFPPGQQNITFAVIIFRDNLHEGTEAFRAISTPSPNFPNFGPPSMGGAFASTDVLILDDDCKLAFKMFNIMLLCWRLVCSCCCWFCAAQLYCERGYLCCGSVHSCVKPTPR